MDAELHTPRIPLEKQKLFIAEYEKVRPLYAELTCLLEKILTRYIDSRSLLAIVQSRTKSIVSFSNKIIHKDKYENPISDVTDLCGARVIVHSQDQVENICNFIKQNFEIDEANSLDLRSRLKVNEFGYRSIHYVISLKANSLSGIALDPKLMNLKGEIQVRTLAEHMWTDISHDRIYKTELNIPDEWKREAARLSAILENADIAFTEMSAQIDSVASAYELQYRAGTIQKEIEKLKALVAVMKNDPEKCICFCLKLSPIYRAMDLYDKALELIHPYLELSLVDPLLRGKLLFDYGLTLALQNSNRISSTSYKQGVRFIEQAFKLFSGLDPSTLNNCREELSRLYFTYGCLLQGSDKGFRKCASFLSQAYGMMPDNPLYLVSLTEAVVLQNLETARENIILFKSNLRTAIVRIQQLIEIGIQRVPAWFAAGRAYILLEDEKGCIHAYSKAVDNILNKQVITSQKVIYAEIAFVTKLRSFNPGISDQILRFLNIAMFLISEGKEKIPFHDFLERQRIRKEPFQTPVLIVAGGAGLMDEKKVEQYKEYICEMQRGFCGTIISGGTTDGIPGLVGSEKKEYIKGSHFELLGYLPRILPGNTRKSNYYNYLHETESNSFSALEILSYWNDLIIGGLNPAEIMLIGIGGGELSYQEYQIAISLGAKVCLISNSGWAVSEIFLDTDWKNHPGLIQLPDDKDTIWAIVNQGSDNIFSEEELESLARTVHKFYRQEQLRNFTPIANDINYYKVIMEWDYLAPELKNSSIRQVVFFPLLLSRVNLAVRKSGKPVLYDIKKNLSPEMFDLLARLEHARWNAERLLEGWKYGRSKDLAGKISPNLVNWEKLSKDVQKFDSQSVENIPLFLEKIGYEIFPLNSNQNRKNTTL